MTRFSKIALTLALLYPAAVFAGFAGTDVFLPSVGSAVGVAPWYTTVWVHNPGNSPATITVYLLKRQANPAPAAFTDFIPAGDTRRYDDAVSFMFHEPVFGALRIVADQKVLVSSRVWSKQPSEMERDSKGQFFGGIPASFAIGAGEKTQIVGVRQTSSDKASSDFRFNVGMVETTGQTCTVTLRLFDELGAPVGSTRTWSLGAREQKQESVWSLFATAAGNHRVEVEVTGGSGKVLAFGSSVANGSDDPSTVEMHFADSLLVEGHDFPLVHDGSLFGDGTAATPLGVADVGVQRRHLAAGAVGTSTIADGTVVRRLNGLTEEVTLLAGSNVNMSTSGQTITISATPGSSGTITGVWAGAGLSGGGSSGDVSLEVTAEGIVGSMLAPNAVNSSKIMNGAVANEDLAGGAVTDAKVNDVAWGKVTGAPASFPPSGAASGDLTGVYPNPTIAAGAVTDVKVSDVAWGKITGMPVGFADGVDNDTTYLAGAGLTLVGSTFALDAAFSDGRYVQKSGDTMSGSLTVSGAGVEVKTHGDNAKLASQNTATDEASGNVVKLEVQNSSGSSLFSVDSEGDMRLAREFWAGGSAGSVGEFLVSQGAGSVPQWQAVGSLPPSGAAGGDLTGNYPNPTIAAGAVTDAKVSDVAWGKITGAPTSLPPSGAAGGDLTGNYPNPTIAAGAVTDAKVSNVGWSKLTGVPAGFADDIDNDTTYTAGTGLTLSGGQFTVDTAVIQARVSGTCAAGSSIRVVNADGTVTCEAIGADWSLLGNSGTSPATNFLGTTDSQSLVFRTANTERMRLDTSGHLGIGTDAPNGMLNVENSSGAVTGRFTSLTTGASTYAVFGATTSSTGGTRTAFFHAQGTAGNTDALYAINDSNTDNAAAGYFLSNGTTGILTGVWADLPTGSTHGLSTAAFFRNRSTSLAGYAGWFVGNVRIQGELTKSSGSFLIDHPLDPLNKTLSHSFVESPDMMNVYNGNIVLDDSGEAWVELPEWFEALNRDFRYQLTCIGGFAPVFIAAEIAGNRFQIGGGKPGLKVSWQVTGIRRDPYAEIHRIVVEQDKRPDEQGKYLCPECYGLARGAGSSDSQRSTELDKNPTR